MKSVKLAEILSFLGNAVVAVIGSIERVVTHPASIQEAQSELAITFSSHGEAEDLQRIEATKAGIVICGTNRLLADRDKTFVFVENPRLSFLRLMKAFFVDPNPKGVHPTAIIDSGAEVHPSVYVGPFTYIGDCEIGSGTVIHGHVHVYSKTRIGRNVTIHTGTVIGADGFGYERNEADEFEKFPHIGGVVIGDGVEIGVNTCIDRGTLGDTIIHEGAKIDNLVHVAHNVVIGHHAAVIAHAMIGGSARIGDHAWIAPSACIRDGISVGQGAMVGLGAVVVKDVEDGATVMGVPARPMEEFKSELQTLRRLAKT